MSKLGLGANIIFEPERARAHQSHNKPPSQVTRGDEKAAYKTFRVNQCRAQLDEHKHLTAMSVPRRWHGSKLGLRRRLQLWHGK